MKAAEAVALNIMKVENNTPSDAEIIRLNSFSIDIVLHKNQPKFR